MKRIYSLLILFIVASIGFHSCDDMDDSLSVTSGLEVQTFIWKGLNLYYLWQQDVPDLADNRFANTSELNDFLYTKETPEILFQDLLNKPISKFPLTEAIDRFSVIVSDYTYLENLFQGITKNNGVEFSLYRESANSNEVLGVVRYIIPNSDASTKSIERGDIFYAINGIALNIDNYNSLLASDTYTLNLADYDNGNITPNGQTVSLTKTELTENPILISKVITNGNHKIAYVMYNGFTANFDIQLNTAFAELKAQGATELVLDLRYNSGGSVQTATRLASMITGQFNGQLFAKQQWNDKLQPIFEARNEANLINNFTNSIEGQAINSLNLSKVYILTTKATASASELVINGLKPYVNVVQIGTTTTGKNVGSITLYDSPTFGKAGRSNKHKYAMQPLVIKTINKDGFGDYQNGLVPTVELAEDINNLGQLGDTNEPLLSTAIGLITANGRMIKQSNENKFIEFRDSKSMKRFGTDMYITADGLPSDMISKLE